LVNVVQIALVRLRHFVARFVVKMARLFEDYRIEGFMLRCACTCLILIAAGRSIVADEPSPEVKAQIKLHTSTLRTSKKSAERAKAAEALGALGGSGMSARRDLCQSMMDSAPSVRKAAADALRKIDEPMYKLATAIFINVDVNAIENARLLGQNAEPLTPLILKVGSNTLTTMQALAAKLDDFSTSSNTQLYSACISVLSEIAASDPAANKFVIGALSFQLPTIPRAPPHYKRDAPALRLRAIKSVRKMANVKQALKPLQTIVNSDISQNRIAATDLLVEIADNDNKAAIKKTLEAQRFNEDANFRQAVDAAIKQLDSK
jgi:hypothetical protein